MKVTALALMFIAASNSSKLPEGLLSAICFAESSHRVHIMHADDGGSTSLGICEIKLSTARMMGFKGDEVLLMNPETNIKYAGKYLAHQFKRYHNPIKAIAAYNTGTYKQTDKGLPVNQKYVNKVMTAWLEKR